MKKIQVNEIKFNKTLRGYEVTEVDSFFKEITNKYNKLLVENASLKKEIENYKKKEEVIQLTLVTAQETGEKLKLEAEKEAKKIKEDAEKLACNLIKETEKEVKAYKDSVLTYFYNYERELSLVLEDFYTVSRKHINNLEHEFMQKIKNKTLKLDKELGEFKLSKELEDKIKSIDNNEPKDIWKQKEYSLILGQRVSCDILNSNNEILVEKGTVVTPELIEILIKKGLYGKLISSIDNKGGNVSD